MSLKLTADDMRYIAIFESLTGAHVRDCVINESGRSITFVVNKDDVGLAIGRDGARVKKARSVIGKGIEVIGYSDDPVEFLKNVFSPAKVKMVNINEHEGKKVAVVTVDLQDKGLAVGRGGKKIQRAKKLLERHHDIHDIFIK